MTPTDKNLGFINYFDHLNKREVILLSCSHISVIKHIHAVKVKRLRNPLGACVLGKLRLKSLVKESNAAMLKTSASSPSSFPP